MERFENADLIAHVQQPGQSHITTPTGSIPNAYNTSVFWTSSGEVPLFLQMKIYMLQKQSSVYLVTVYYIIM